MPRKKSSADSNTATLEPPVSSTIDSIRNRLDRDKVEAVSVYRAMIEAMSRGEHASIEIIQKVWKQTGWRGDLENTIRQDVADLKACRRAQQMAEADSLGAWHKKHGSRKKLWDQAAALRVKVAELEAAIRQHDSLERTTMVIQQAAAIKKSNSRLFDISARKTK